MMNACLYSSITYDQLVGMRSKCRWGREQQTCTPNYPRPDWGRDKTWPLHPSTYKSITYCILTWLNTFLDVYFFYNPLIKVKSCYHFKNGRKRTPDTPYLFEVAVASVSFSDFLSRCCPGSQIWMFLPVS